MMLVRLAATGATALALLTGVGLTEPGTASAATETPHLTLTQDRLVLDLPGVGGTQTARIEWLKPQADPGTAVEAFADRAVIARTDDSQLFRVASGGDGPSLVIFVPPRATATTNDYGLAYAYSPDATTAAWNPAAWSSETAMRLDGVERPLVVGAGQAVLPAARLGATLELRELVPAALLSYSDDVVTAAELARALPTTTNQATLDALLAEPPALTDDVLDASLVSITDSPGLAPVLSSARRCEDLGAVAPEDACPEEVAGASKSSEPAILFPEQVLMTRPVFKSFIPEPTISPLLPRSCDVSKVSETFQGDSRGPGPGQLSSKTTAFWDLEWRFNSGKFDRRIGPTVRLASSDGIPFTPELLQTREASPDTIQGSPGIHYQAGGVSEGFREVRFRVASGNPFCTFSRYLTIDQNNGQVDGSGAFFSNRPPFWENDGSLGSGFRHDIFPAHEYYSYSYLPGIRVVNALTYSWTPPLGNFQSFCLANVAPCPTMRVNLETP
jgi:hypothetical protein